MESLIDNDILVKVACYNLFSELIGGIISAPAGVLGAARYVGRDAIGNASLKGDRAEAIERLENFIESSSIVEPTDEEQRLAADFEEAGQRLGVALDAGESQLCAILIVRALRGLWTGDKRAIVAIESLLPFATNLSALAGKIGCLEQLVTCAIDGTDGKLLRSAVCAEPDVDRTLTICFSCGSPESDVESIIAGLFSYINDLRSKAQTVLSH